MVVMGTDGRGAVRVWACPPEAGTRRRSAALRRPHLVTGTARITRLAAALRKMHRGVEIQIPNINIFSQCRPVFFSISFRSYFAAILIPFPQMFTSLGVVFSEVETLLSCYSACKAVVAR